MPPVTVSLRSHTKWKKNNLDNLKANLVWISHYNVPGLTGLCGQGRGSCSMYPSWSLILIWSWILIRLRNGGTLSPVQTLRIPAEPKRRRRVRITPSENISRYVNKCSYQGVYLGRHLWSKPKYKDLPWILKWAKKSKKNKTKQNQKLWISKYNVLYRTCNYWKHSTTALYYIVYVKKDKNKKNKTAL